ncbi:MAG: GxxExxY protein [Rhizomicrobium sp.]
MDVARGAAENAEVIRSLDDVTGLIVDASYRLHARLGPGLLESVYEVVLARDLARRGLLVERQHAVSFEYDGLQFDDAYRVDILVNRCVVVEIKSVERALPVHAKQLLTYLRLLNLSVGLLVNFGAPTFKEGVQRIVNRLPSSASPRLRVNQTPAWVSITRPGNATPPSIRRWR